MYAIRSYYEAYRPGIAVQQNGKVEDWYKFERMKVLQDKYGRASYNFV